MLSQLRLCLCLPKISENCYKIMQNLRITKKRARVSNAQTFHIIRDGLFYKIEN